MRSLSYVQSDDNKIVVAESQFPLVQAQLPQNLAFRVAFVKKKAAARQKYKQLLENELLNEKFRKIKKKLSVSEITFVNCEEKHKNFGKSIYNFF